MICPICKEDLMWQGEFSCDEVYECECGEGIVGEYKCKKCNAVVTIVTGCKQNVEEPLN